MVPHFGVVPAGVTGLLFENYIVDASILKQFFDEPGSASPFFGVWLFHWFSREALFDLCGQVFKSTRWMPWHQEPKKDVGICDKPGGVDNRTVIPGCPNGETPPGARVTG